MCGSISFQDKYEVYNWRKWVKHWSIGVRQWRIPPLLCRWCTNLVKCLYIFTGYAKISISHNDYDVMSIFLVFREHELGSQERERQNRGTREDVMHNGLDLCLNWWRSGGRGVTGEHGWLAMAWWGQFKLKWNGVNYRLVLGWMGLQLVWVWVCAISTWVQLQTSAVSGLSEVGGWLLTLI